MCLRTTLTDFTMLSLSCALIVSFLVVYIWGSVSLSMLMSMQFPGL